MVKITICINVVVAKELESAYLSAAIRKKLKYCWPIECLQTTHDEIGFIQSGWSQGQQLS